jgi:hypothetical protein
MRNIQKIFCCGVLILSLLSISFSSSSGNSKGPGYEVVFGTGAILMLGMFDIASAPVSAKKYNDNLLILNSKESLQGNNITPSYSYPFGEKGFLQSNLNNRFIQSVDITSSSSLESQRKHYDSALLWSLGATAIPIYAGIEADKNGEGFLAGLLIATGVIIGPSVGHFYAEQEKRGILTISLRASIAIVSLALATDR